MRGVRAGRTGKPTDRFSRVGGVDEGERAVREAVVFVKPAVFREQLARLEQLWRRGKAIPNSTNVPKKAIVTLMATAWYRLWVSHKSTRREICRELSDTKRRHGDKARARPHPKLDRRFARISSWKKRSGPSTIVSVPVVQVAQKQEARSLARSTRYGTSRREQ
ncbi:hypothetical protein K438DRAFT_1756985 [Mycena galopus ATCC 62051]|nr:hypothetical protein K438DRAFT_1756985 [Mycena galopus ATCC 62051]